MMAQLIKILKMIIWHPSNKGQVLNRILIFLGWQILKRSARLTVLVTSCGKRFLAYPDCPVSSMLLYFNVPEYEELSILKSYCQKRKDVFFDIGANIGFYSIAMEEYFVAVHAFEPNPEANRRLKENSMLNGLTTKANNLAVSNREGIIHLCVRGNADPTAHLQDFASEDTISVPVVSLDKYIQKNQVKEKIVVKIDVEGEELRVLEGSVESLRRKQFSIMQFESLTQEHFASIIKFVKLLPYGVYATNNNKLVPIDRRKEGVNNYYLLPLED